MVPEPLTIQDPLVGFEFIRMPVGYSGRQEIKLARYLITLNCLGT